MNLLKLLRSQASRYRCPECGHSMADCGIEILEQQGNHAKVRITCSSCHDENMLQIVLQGEAAAALARPRRPPLFDEPRPNLAAEPIAADEVLEVHSVLEGWDGDVSSLLGERG